MGIILLPSDPGLIWAEDSTGKLCDGKSGGGPAGGRLVAGEAICMDISARVGTLFIGGIGVVGPCLDQAGLALIPLAGMLPLFIKTPCGVDQGVAPAEAGMEGGIRPASVSIAMRRARLRRAIKTMIRMLINRTSAPTTPPTSKSMSGELVVFLLLLVERILLLVVGVEFPPGFCVTTGVSVAPAAGVTLAWTVGEIAGVGSTNEAGVGEDAEVGVGDGVAFGVGDGCTTGAL